MTDPHPQEAALIHAAINANDAAAFQTLYQHYVRRIYAYVAARVENPQDAEDIVSDVFLRMIKSLDQLRNPHESSLTAWLFRIARNALADHYRRDPHPPEKIIALAQVAASDPAPDVAAEHQDDAARLRQQIAALSDRKREIITLRYYGGLRNHEIAAVLGIGEKTVSAYLSRALSDLQEHYLPQNPASPRKEAHS